MSLTKKIAIAVLALVLVAGGFVVYRMGGLRFVVGYLRYDQRREGSLKVADKAPDVVLESLNGAGGVNLSRYIGAKPLVVVFGSYT